MGLFFPKYLGSSCQEVLSSPVDSLPRVQGKAQRRVKTNLFGRDNQGFVRFHASLHYHIFLWLLFPTQQICMLRTALQAAQMQGLLVPGEK